jgi:hypothetical protein
MAGPRQPPPVIPMHAMPPHPAVYTGNNHVSIASQILKLKYRLLILFVSNIFFRISFSQNNDRESLVNFVAIFQILAHLMSNPGVMTAESFERQQRFESQSPAEQSPPVLPAMPHLARSAEDLESDLKAKLSMKTSSYAEAASASKAQKKKGAAPPPVAMAPETEAPKLMSPMAFADPAAKGSNKKNRQVQVRCLAIPSASEIELNVRKDASC